MAEETCPKCSKDDTRKVSAVVDEGSWSANTSGWRVEIGRDRRGRRHPTVAPYNETTRGRTKLAEMLASPEPPFPGVLVFGVVLVALFFLLLWVGVAGALAGLIGQPLANIGAIVAVVVLVLYALPALTSLYERASKRQDEVRARWESQKRNWEALRYCARCDVVYHPESGKTAAPSSMRSLL